MQVSLVPRFLLRSVSVMWLDHSYLSGDAGDDGDFPRLGTTAFCGRTGGLPCTLSHRLPLRVRNDRASISSVEGIFLSVSVSGEFCFFPERQIQTKYTTDTPRQTNQRSRPAMTHCDDVRARDTEEDEESVFAFRFSWTAQRPLQYMTRQFQALFVPYTLTQSCFKEIRMTRESGVRTGAIL